MRIGYRSFRTPKATLAVAILLSVSATGLTVTTEQDTATPNTQASSSQDASTDQTTTAGPGRGTGLFAPAPRPGGAGEQRASAIESEATTQRVGYVRFDQSVLRQAQTGLAPEYMELGLFDDVVYTAVLRSTSRPREGFVSWSGRLKGVEPSAANFVISPDGAVAGSVVSPDGEFHIRAVDEETYAVVEFDDTQASDEHIGSPASLSAPGQVQAATDDDPVVLDMLVLYTPEARDEAGGRQAIEATALHFLEQTNNVYRDSGVFAQLRLVDTAEFDFKHVIGKPDGTNLLLGDIDALRDPDGFPAKLRDQVGADLVALLSRGHERGVAGAGFVPISPGGPVHPASAYSWSAAQYGPLVFAHEVGHNLGLWHDREASSNRADAFPHAYNFGLRQTQGDPLYRTIMAYECPHPARCPKVGLHSNPDVEHNGMPSGVPEGQPGAANAARALNENAPVAAAFRDPVSEPVLFGLEVSTDFTGDASGSVRGLGINCPPSCTEVYPSSYVVRLEPRAGEDAVFKGWSGDCTGRSACQIAMDGPRHVTAHFEPRGETNRTLEVSVTGQGIVSSTGPPAALSCPPDCEELVADGDVIELSASPRHGWEFSGWAGDCVTSTTFPQHVSRSVNFGSNRTSISVSEPTGTAPGDVLVAVLTQNRPGMHPTPAGWTQVRSDVYTGPASADVRQTLYTALRGESPPSFTFEAHQVGNIGLHVSRISGANPSSPVAAHVGATTSGEQQSSAVTIPQLEALSPNTLLLAAASSASGESVPVVPASMTAVWSLGFRFSPPAFSVATQAWPVGDTGSRTFTVSNDTQIVAAMMAIAPFERLPGPGENCTVDVDSDKEVLATFSPIGPHALEVSVSGEGSVVGDGGINCPAVCTASYGPATEVTLEAVPASGMSFAGWSGDCSGTGSCTFTTPSEGSSSLEVLAVFTDDDAHGLKTQVEGPGTITDGGDLSCPPDCFVAYPDGTEVTLQASAVIPGQLFTEVTTAYVANLHDSTLTPIDTSTNTAGDPIDLEGLSLSAIVASPQGHTLHVAGSLGPDSDSEGRLVSVDLVTNTPAPPIDLGLNAPADMAISPDGQTLYVTGVVVDQTIPSTQGAVAVVDTQTSEVTGLIDLGEELIGGIAIAPDGSTAYVSGQSSPAIHPIDLATGTVGDPIEHGGIPFAGRLAITPDGSVAYVLTIHVAPGEEELAPTVTPIDLGAQVAGDPIEVASAPEDVVITPDGSTVYVTTFDHVVPIDTSTNTVLDPIEVGQAHAGMALIPDGQALYVTHFLDGLVTPIDTSTNTPADPIEVGEGPFAIAVATTLREQPRDPAIEWSGECAGSEGTCTVTMDEPKQLTVKFSQESGDLLDLEVVLEGSGAGSVSGSGISCPDNCIVTYGEGTEVTLVAQPAASSAFTGWTGACTGTGECRVLMIDSVSVTATFELLPPATHRLIVHTEGEGTGSVESSPEGISCPHDCEAVYEEGVEVTLTATPSEGSSFGGWSGACSGADPCTLTLTEDMETTAVFNEDPVSPDREPERSCSLVWVTIKLLMIRIPICI